jgi:hypothetical protein
MYSYLTLVDPAKDPAESVKVEMHDPNTGVDKEIKMNLHKYEGESLHKIAAKEMLDNSF